MFGDSDWLGHWFAGLQQCDTIAWNGCGWEPLDVRQCDCFQTVIRSGIGSGIRGDDRGSVEQLDGLSNDGCTSCQQYDTLQCCVIRGAECDGGRIERGGNLGQHPVQGRVECIGIDVVDIR